MKIVSLAEVKNKLSSISTEREQPTREQKIALDHSEHVVTLSATKTIELVRELKQLERVNKKQAYKIADTLPETEDEVMALFTKETFVPSKEERQRILDIVWEYL